MPIDAKKHNLKIRANFPRIVLADGLEIPVQITLTPFDLEIRPLWTRQLRRIIAPWPKIIPAMTVPGGLAHGGGFEGPLHVLVKGMVP